MNRKRLEAYLHRGQRRVEGWLVKGAAETIVALSDEQKRAGVNGAVGEIGIHHGKLFIVLYLTGENEPAVAIDLFSAQHLNVDQSGGGNFAKFERNMQQFADTKRLVVQEGDSTKMNADDLLRLGKGEYRFFSIDGGHTPEITAHDLSIADGALAPGGVIIIDDCFNELFPGVCDGIFQYFAEPRNIIPFGICSNKVFFCHRGFSDRYLQVMRQLDGIQHERSFLQSPVVYVSFAKEALTVRIGKMSAWRKVKDLPPSRLLRWIYHKTKHLLPA